MNEYIQALPGILFWVGLFVVLRVTRKKREEASRRPKNAAQRELVDDVIATIERTAPDFDGADVYPSSIVKSSDGSYGGYVSFHLYAETNSNTILALMDMSSSKERQ